MKQISIGTSITSAEPFASKPAGVFRRLIAYVIDCLVIAIVGLLFFPFESLVEKLGTVDWLPIFALGIIYFTIFDSILFDGSSIGKKVMKIKLVGERGNTISPLRAAIRATLVSFPFYNQQIGQLFPANISNIVGIFYVFLVVIIFVGISLFLASNPQKEGLQDLLTKTYVIPVVNTLRLLPIKTGFRPAIFSIIGVLILGATMISAYKKLPETNSNKALNERIRRDALNENLFAGYREFYMDGKRSWYAVEIAVPTSYSDFENKDRMRDISANLFSIAKKSNQNPEVDSVRLVISSKKYFGLHSTGYGSTELKKLSEIE